MQIKFNNNKTYQDITPKTNNITKEGFIPNKKSTLTIDTDENINEYKLSKNIPREIKNDCN